MTLDKFSWYLYQNNAFEKALEVSDRALEMVIETEESDRTQRIEEHRQLIRTESWKQYY